MKASSFLHLGAMVRYIKYDDLMRCYCRKNPLTGKIKLRTTEQAFQKLERLLKKRRKAEMRQIKRSRGREWEAIYTEDMDETV